VADPVVVPRRRRRRGRAVGIGLLVFLLLIIGALVVVDRIGANVAADRVAAQASKEMQARGMTSPSSPRASVGGFPFLTQVLRGVYEKITIKVDQPQTKQVKLDQLTLVATDVRAPASDLINGTGTVIARQLTGTATMGWDAVKSLIELTGLPSGIDPSQLQVKVVDNNVELRLPLQLAGLSTTLRATGTLAVADGKVKLQLTDVGVEGADSPLLQALVRGFRSRLTATIRVPQMPYHLVVKKVETSSSGVLVTATADDVKLAG
jgi:LmeA-like phospholipid-binding